MRGGGGKEEVGDGSLLVLVLGPAQFKALLSGLLVLSILDVKEFTFGMILYPCSLEISSSRHDCRAVPSQI